MKVLVTGGAGYIGSHVCKALAEQGHVPVSYDNLTTGHRDAVRWGPLEHGDIRDSVRLAQVMRSAKPDAIMHFAASAYVGESVADPSKYYDNNVGGSLSVIRCAIEAGIGSFVFSSSCATYGIPDALPIHEGTPQNPINPYGRTKLIVEEMLRDHVAAHPLKVVSLRYFNAAGADPDGELGERHDPETHLIPCALLAAAGRSAALSLFGDDYPTPDGTCIRDYIHVTDLAAGHVLALDHLARGGDTAFLNLGTGRGYSIREILAGIEAVTGRSVPVRVAGRRPGDPAALVADPSAASRLLGFRPLVSDLETILRTAAPHFGLDVTAPRGAATPLPPPPQAKARRQ